MGQNSPVKGIGSKTAKRIVLELKGKVEELGIAARLPVGAEAQAAQTLGEDLMAALVGLGFPRAKARDAVLRVLAENPDVDDLEQLVKAALAVMSA